MTIDSKIENGRGILIPHGSIDSTTADSLESAASVFDLEALDGLTFDFSDVDYISSKCLRVLVSLNRKLQGKPITILGANETVLDIFKLSGLSKLFNVQ